MKRAFPQYALPYQSFSDNKRMKLVNDIINGVSTRLNQTMPAGGSQTQTQTKKVKRVAKRRMIRNAYLAGKVRTNKRVSRVNYKKKKLTSFGFANKGITYNVEYREAPLDTLTEASYIGHMSMPARLTLDNVCRALVKALIKRGGRDLSSLNATWASNDVGGSVGDIIRINYYATQTTTSVTTVDHSVLTNQTVDQVALSLSTVLSGISTTGYNSRRRWYYAEYIPASNITRLNACRINLQYMKVHIKTKSHLKVQNRTVNNVTDTQADDVDNVPLEGRLYKVTGNMLLHVGTRICPTDVPNSQGTVLRRTIATDMPLSEPPNAYEFTNCTSSGKIRINPGGIKTSSIKETKMYYWTTLMDIILGDGHVSTSESYKKSAGKSVFFGLEKVVGNYATPVLIAYEVDFQQQVAVVGGLANITEAQNDQS